MSDLGGITQETIDETRGIITAGRTALRTPSTKAITAAGNVLYGYPLESPAKKLYPVEDTMRRRIPRYVNPTGGTYAHWKQVTAINAAKVKAGVAEGAVNTAIGITDAEMSAKYKTISMSGSYTDEARIMGRKFEDIPAFAMLSTLQSLMIAEDRLIIGGNITTLNTAMAAATITATAATTAGGALVSATAYSFAVSALTLQGYLNGATGRGTADSADETIAKPLANQTPGGTDNAMILAWTDVPGAVAYNVFVSTNATNTPFYLATVTKNTYTVEVNKTSGNVSNTADQTANPLEFDGILPQLVASGSGAYYLSKAGAALTADGAGGITEFDVALKSIWDTARIGPTLMLINSQEATSIKKLAVGSSSTNAVRVMVSNEGVSDFKAGAGVKAYYNPYTDQYIPMVTSLHCPPGKVMLIGERVPYPNAETPQNFEMELQQDYYGEEFARTARSTPIAVTAIGVLKVYFPPACGIIANIAAS